MSLYGPNDTPQLGLNRFVLRVALCCFSESTISTGLFFDVQSQHLLFFACFGMTSFLCVAKRQG